MANAETDVDDLGVDLFAPERVLIDESDQNAGLFADLPVRRGRNRFPVEELDEVVVEAPNIFPGRALPVPPRRPGLTTQQLISQSREKLRRLGPVRSVRSARRGKKAKPLSTDAKIRRLRANGVPAKAKGTRGEKGYAFTYPKQFAARVEALRRAGYPMPGEIQAVRSVRVVRSVRSAKSVRSGRARRSGKRASAAQLAQRKKFAAAAKRYGGRIPAGTRLGRAK
jgi:hypothetical protein